MTHWGNGGHATDVCVRDEATCLCVYVYRSQLKGSHEYFIIARHMSCSYFTAHVMTLSIDLKAPIKRNGSDRIIVASV